MSDDSTITMQVFGKEHSDVNDVIAAMLESPVEAVRAGARLAATGALENLQQWLRAELRLGTDPHSIMCALIGVTTKPFALLWLVSGNRIPPGKDEEFVKDASTMFADTITSYLKEMDKP